MSEELRPWEVAKLIEEAGGPVELEVWDNIGAIYKKNISAVYPCNDYPFRMKEYSIRYQHARLPQKPERRKITDRYRLLKRCRELDAQGNGILVRLGNGDWKPWMYFGFLEAITEYQYTHLDDDGKPTGEPQDFWE